jgi:hypothetical protein
MGRIRFAGRLFGEFVRFARDNRAYWIIPLVLFLGAAAFLIVAGQTVAPLLYTLF